MPSIRPPNDASVALFYEMFDDASDLVFLVTLDGNIEFANATARSLLELPGDAATPTALLDLLSDACRVTMEAWFDRARRGISDARIELVLRSASGRDIRAHGSIRCNSAEGKDRRIRLVLQAQTSEDEALRLLRQSNDVFRSVAEAQAAYLERGDCRGAISRLLHYALQQTQSEYGFFGVMVAGRLRVLAHDGIVFI